MRTLVVVMVRVGPQDSFEVAATKHQDVVEALGPYRLDPVGYRNSCRDAVLVDETAHHVPPPNVGGPQVTHR
jgi:hypothetical protein